MKPIAVVVAEIKVWASYLRRPTEWRGDRQPAALAALPKAEKMKLPDSCPGCLTRLSDGNCPTAALAALPKAERMETAALTALTQAVGWRLPDSCLTAGWGMETARQLLWLPYRRLRDGDTRHARVATLSLTPCPLSAAFCCTWRVAVGPPWRVRIECRCRLAPCVPALPRQRTASVGDRHLTLSYDTSQCWDVTYTTFKPKRYTTSRSKECNSVIFQLCQHSPACLK